MNTQPWGHLVTFDRVLELHADGIRRFGGAPGLKSTDCVESSLGSAWSAQLYMDEEQVGFPLTFATYLFVYITKNHCFEDGNKRLGWYVLGEALALMGLTISASDDEATDFVMGVAAQQPPDYATVQNWIAQRIIAAPNAEG
ncbi:type II toxin-antitoxin system death-on-curing family toxin [Archangium gephyra]|uniref:type II toxin-antitoxin system death-on-curing family toxin n=1 Tax=Archangium gephyra TaxID=48 RepID=UPI003B77CB58